MFTIQVQQADATLLNEVIDDLSIETKILTTKNFNGQTELIKLFCEATLMAIPFITRIIVVAIKSRKDIEIKYNGITIQGLSQDNATEILKELIDKK